MLVMLVTFVFFGMLVVKFVTLIVAVAFVFTLDALCSVKLPSSVRNVVEPVVPVAVLVVLVVDVMGVDVGINVGIAVGIAVGIVVIVAGACVVVFH